MKVGAGAEMFTAKIARFFVQGCKKYRKKIKVPSGLAATVDHKLGSVERGTPGGGGGRVVQLAERDNGPKSVVLYAVNQVQTGQAHQTEMSRRSRMKTGIIIQAFQYTRCFGQEYAILQCCRYTRSIMNVSRPPRGATVAFRLLGESAPRRPVAWDGLAC